MLDAIASALQAREEKLQFAGMDLIVRELQTAADVGAFRDGEDAQLKLVVRCVFLAENNAPVFSDEDIPLLRESGRKRFAPILEAVNRVNGLDLADNAKNSVAAPDSASSTNSD